MKKLGAICQGLLLGAALFFACHQFLTHLQAPRDKGADNGSERVFIYQLY